MSFIFGDAETYEVDLELFNKLGLEPFKTDNQEKFFVGEYKLPEDEKASIKIWVTCMPAMFWEFEVKTDENQKYIIETGSGALSDYWDGVIKVAEGCFDVTKVNNI